MIRYRPGYLHPCALFQCAGSGLPVALTAAVLCGLVGFLLKLWTTSRVDFVEWADDSPELGATFSVGSDSAYLGFTLVCGFALLFRTSQANSRLCDGYTAMQTMAACWFDAASAIVAFSRFSSEFHKEGISHFNDMLVRLLSLLHAAALSDLKHAKSSKTPRLEQSRSKDGRALLMSTQCRDASNDIGGEATGLEVLDVGTCLDEQRLQALQLSEHKVELICQWLQALMVDNIKSGALCIPHALLSRSFQGLSSGRTSFFSAQRFVDAQCPFACVRTMELLLVIHWLATPIVACDWAPSPTWVGIFCFIQALLLWSLHAMAIELDSFFGEGANAVDAQELQRTMNCRLLLLLDATAGLVSRPSKEEVFDDQVRSEVSTATNPSEASTACTRVRSPPAKSVRLSASSVSSNCGSAQLEMSLGDKADPKCMDVFSESCSHNMLSEGCSRNEQWMCSGQFAPHVNDTMSEDVEEVVDTVEEDLVQDIISQSRLRCLTGDERNRTDSYHAYVLNNETLSDEVINFATITHLVPLEAASLTSQIFHLPPMEVSSTSSPLIGLDVQSGPSLKVAKIRRAQMESILWPEFGLMTAPANETPQSRQRSRPSRQRSFPPIVDVSQDAGSLEDLCANCEGPPQESGISHEIVLDWSGASPAMRGIVGLNIIDLEIPDSPWNDGSKLVVEL